MLAKSSFCEYETGKTNGTGGASWRTGGSAPHKKEGARDWADSPFLGRATLAASIGVGTIALPANSPRMMNLR
jgi:hypothetical protein